MDPGWPITPVQKRSVATPLIFMVIQVERETVMTAWRLHWGTRELGQYWVICCLSCCFACLIYLFSFCDIFVASFIYVLIIVVSFTVCLWIGVSTHTHVHLHNISSVPELRPFRRKCWLRSREIVISAMASQTLPEFMVLMTSWGCNLRSVIRKCSHSNRTLSIWSL